MRKSYLRFSLRGLLLAVTIFAIWLGVHVRRAQTQKEAVQAIQEYGGWVRYDYQFPSGEFGHKGFDPEAVSWVPERLVDAFGIDFFHSVVQVNLNYSTDSGVRQENRNISDEALQLVGRLPRLRVLLLSGTQARDDSLNHLTRLTKLQRLYMWDVGEVSDQGVRHLAPLKELQYIHLSNSRISDESMKVFATFPKLEGLSLQGNRFSNDALEHISQSTRLQSLVIGLGDISVDDEGLVFLKDLQNLEKLGLQKSDVTGAGLLHLEELKNLKELWIDVNQVAGPGVERLRAAKPGIIVK